MSLSSLKRKSRFFIIKLSEMEVIRENRATSGEGYVGFEELEMQPVSSIQGLPTLQPNQLHPNF